MNFRDMTPEEGREYDKLMYKSDFDWVLKNLAITAGIVVIAMLVWLLG